VSAVEGLRRIISALVSFALKNPYFYEMIRSVGIDSISRNARNKVLPEWDRKRHELQCLVESTIRHGVQAGEIERIHSEVFNEASEARDCFRYRPGRPFHRFPHNHSAVPAQGNDLALLAVERLPYRFTGPVPRRSFYGGVRLRHR